MKKVLVAMAALIVATSTVYASDKADEIMAKEIAREMKCDHKAAQGMASTTSECGALNGGVSAFGFNLPADYSAKKELGDWEQRPEGQVAYTESRMDYNDRVIVQKRMIWTNQIQPAQTITEVYLKTPFGLRKVQ